MTTLMLAQLRAQSDTKNAKAERFADVIKHAGVKAKHGVGVGVHDSDHKDGDSDAPAAEKHAHVSAVRAGETYVE